MPGAVSTESEGRAGETVEWFARADGPEGGAGLRFGCTMCGNCCSGPPGYVLVNDAECAALADRFGVTVTEFIERYTHVLAEGRSLVEREGPRGFDCVFLDRAKVPGRAVCGVYEDRPRQCRTWPFWNSVLRDGSSWARAGGMCPGINKGELTPVVQVRVMRGVVDI